MSFKQVRANGRQLRAMVINKAKIGNRWQPLLVCLAGRWCQVSVFTQLKRKTARLAWHLCLLTVPAWSALDFSY
jgi:hypothetical protein